MDDKQSDDICANQMDKSKQLANCTVILKIVLSLSEPIVILNELVDLTTNISTCRYLNINDVLYIVMIVYVGLFCTCLIDYRQDISPHCTSE